MHQIPLVSDVMDRTFPTVKPTTGINDAIDLIRKKKVTGMLVVNDDGMLVGILSEKDCLKILLHDGFHRLPDDSVASYMHEVPRTVESSEDIITVAQLFLGSVFRRFPVVDDGRLVGQITQRDILRSMKDYFKQVN